MNELGRKSVIQNIHCKRSRAGEPRQAKRHGFSLTELAIVLSVVGVVLGSIWTAASTAYKGYKATDIIHSIQIFQQNARNLYSTMKPVLGDLTMNDSCGGTPCSTQAMLAAGIFEPGFIPTNTITNVIGQSMFMTKQRYPIWTGVFNSSLYIHQIGNCGSPPLPSCGTGTTVLEIDLYNLSALTCTNLILQLVNSHIDGLTDVIASNNGWGPVIGKAYFGNPALPASISPAVAAEACATQGGAFGYITATQPYIWLVFDVSSH